MTRMTRTITAGVRRGISMIEVLVALAIVIALMAVVLPWTFEWLGSRELDHAEDRLAMHMMMARAAAREEGRPIEVIAEVGSLTGSVHARWMNLDDGDAESARSGLDSLDGAVFGAASPDALDPDSIEADWARFEFPAGIRIAFDGSVGTDVDADTDSASSFDEASDDETAFDGVDADASDALAAEGNGGNASASQTLAIFLPDGTVIVAPIFMLQTDAGVARAMRVDRVTGRPRAVPTVAIEPQDGAHPTVRPEFDPAD